MLHVESVKSVGSVDFRADKSANEPFPDWLYVAYVEPHCAVYGRSFGALQLVEYANAITRAANAFDSCMACTVL